MFIKPSRGQRGPHIIFFRDSDGPIRLDEARLAAWALSLGQKRASDHQQSRRPHRGMLPDVDFSRAVAAPRRPGLFARLFRSFFAPGHASAGDAGLSGAANAGLGNSAPNAYVQRSGQTESAAPAGGKRRGRVA